MRGLVLRVPLEPAVQGPQRVHYLMAQPLQVIRLMVLQLELGAAGRHCPIRTRRRLGRRPPPVQARGRGAVQGRAARVPLGLVSAQDRLERPALATS